MPSAPTLQIAGVVVGLTLMALWPGSIGVSGGSSEGFSLKNIQDQVARDTVVQYRIAARQGDKMQICVMAGMVTAAFLQAHDEKNYRAWKDVEREDCDAIGMPRF